MHRFFKTAEDAFYRLRPVVNSYREEKLFTEGRFERMDEFVNGMQRQKVAKDKLFILATEGAGLWIDGKDEATQTALGLVAFWPLSLYEQGFREAAKTAASCLSEHWHFNLASCPAGDHGRLLREATELLLKRYPQKEKVWAAASKAGIEEEVLNAAGFLREASAQEGPLFYDGEGKHRLRGASLWSFPRASVTG